MDHGGGRVLGLGTVDSMAGSNPRQKPHLGARANFFLYEGKYGVLSSQCGILFEKPQKPYPKREFSTGAESLSASRRVFFSLDVFHFCDSFTIMGILEKRWISLYWASFSIITYTSLVGAGNVVQLAVGWQGPPPGLVNNQTSLRLKARSYIEEGMYNNVSRHAFGSYMANVTIGTPGQQLSLVIVTGSADTIVLASTAYECNQKTWPDGDGPCYGGTC
jgi:Eukaryotic aspartyl protease